MLGRVILFFVLVPLIELVLLSQMLQQTGLLLTIALVLITGVVGASLAKQQGMRVWKSIHQQMAQGQTPSKDIVSGLMILLAGAFLITPGILTDACGFLLLIPQIRIRLGLFLAEWFKAKTVSKFQTSVWSSTDVPVAEDDGIQPGVRVVEPDETQSVSK